MNRKSLARAVVVLLGCGLAVLLALPWCDVLVGNVVPVLQALTVVWILAAVMVFLLALALRRRWAILAFTPALLLAFAASWLLTTSGAQPPAPVQNGNHTLTMLSLNAELGGADAASVVRLIQQRKPDVVVFVEMTKNKLDDMDSRGLRAQLPYRTEGMIDDGARGSIVLSRWPLKTVDADQNLGHFDLQSPIAQVQAPGATVLVRAVHSYPPLRDGVDQWRPQLQRLEAWQKAHSQDHVILAGDFNASVAHPAFRALRDGMVDAVAQQETAAWPTWPHGSWVPPFVQIDHILTRGFAPEKAGTTGVPNTDHAAIWAQLRY